ncbi:hypothetical protein [Streptomyces sp. DH12]|uniref:hypothetical protein n=1 Tax=Streptomyces sp. DH12 TaxID=2857010 RepID=UPI001E361D1B|nr:hypothetical protein [Streptomyces sp. DH12]
MGTTLLYLSLPLAVLALHLYIAFLIICARRARDRLRDDRRRTAAARLTAAAVRRDTTALAAHLRHGQDAERAVLAAAEHIVDTAYATHTAQEGGHP